MRAVRLLLAFVFPGFLACSGALLSTAGPASSEAPEVPAPREQSPLLGEAPPLLHRPTPPEAGDKLPAVRRDSNALAEPSPRGGGHALASAGEQRLARLAAERVNAEPRGNYVIGAGDLVEINVFDLAEMSRKERVTSGGFIQMPLIGAVQAGGRTEAELAADIASRLAGNYLQNPQVSVFVNEYKSQQVAVTGSVAKPGLYPLTREHYTILDMLSEAGGRTRDAGSIIQFVPAPAGGTSSAFAAARAGAEGVNPGRGDASSDVVSVDLDQLMQSSRNVNLSFPLVAGDVIYVSEAGSFTVEGWVERPGAFPITRNMTVLGSISSAGGPLFPAALSRVEILRAQESRDVRSVLTVDLAAIGQGEQPDVELRSGDVVRVPGSVPLMIPWGFWQLLTTIVRFGASVATPL